MSYLFYLEPYTFILNGKDMSVVYNTLNAAYIPFPKHPVIDRIKAIWEKASNGYCCEITEEEKTDAVVADFIHEVQESFSGDCISWDTGKKKPFIFKPQLFLNSEIQLRKEKNETLWGKRIMQNLKEVTLYVPTPGCTEDERCEPYYKQLLHCMIFPEDRLTIDDYIDLLKRLEIYGVKRVNLIANNNPFENNYMQEIMALHKSQNYKLHVYMGVKTLTEGEQLPKKNNILWEVSVLGEDMETFAPVINACERADVLWNIVVTCEKDMDRLSDIQGRRMKVKPYYTGSNLQFFENYVFMTLDDLLSEPVDRQSIFRHQALNDHFFGKMIIMPTGEVYSSLWSEPLGNIKEAKLKQMLYREFSERSVWLGIRSKVEPCKDCVNRDLCPSISNYELAIGRNNLCHIQ